MKTILTGLLVLVAKALAAFVGARSADRGGQDAYQHERDRDALDTDLADDPAAARRKLRDEWSRPD